jgi:hypothetical protein
MRGLVTIALALLAACGDPLPIADAPGKPAQGIFQTAGGGTASSATYKVRLSIGAPQPMGAATSQYHALRVGPR